MYFKITSVSDQFSSDDHLSNHHHREASSSFVNQQQSHQFGGDNGQSEHQHEQVQHRHHHASNAAADGNCQQNVTRQNTRRSRTLSREEINALVLTKLIVSRWGDSGNSNDDIDSEE
eukprot:TRINITY_DN17453_c0_g1_i10.p1 TRINITY_DN17453_c0_g1~~TRINITY_DN17453_c0_g1_i10.p1  ORF type:complete len:117 (-),score=25.58 TRINITY_DN17453_c0_g1_i10:291-641(-)